MSKPICFKIRGGVEREDGSRGSTHIGKMAGKGYLGSEDQAFTFLSTNDQYLFAGQGEGSYAFPFNKPPMRQRKLKYLSLFSGIEAASVAWKDLGWEPVGFSEIEPFPCAVLKHRFPNTPNYGDITKWKEWGLVPGTVDVVCAGSPCQAFSTAGLRKGLDDPRGNLALVTLGLVEFLKPKWFIWENVPGVLTSQQGSAFGAILTALGDIGYGWSYRVLDAQHFGVAQRRRRVWLCGYRDPVTGAGDWRPPSAVLSFSESLCWNPATFKRKRKAGASDAQGGPGQGDSGCWWDGGQVSQTLDAVLSKGQTMPEKNRFPAVLQPIVIDRAAFNQGINAQYDGHIKQEETMVPLVAKGPHAVAHIDFRNAELNTDVSHTLQAKPNGGISLNFIGGVLETSVAPASVAPTITQSGPPYSRVGNERVESEALVVYEKQTIDESNKVDDASRVMSVRRITPREGERLQGFPDDWTLIPWKGKPLDECPDGPRYKAIGNSWAVPCARYIGERINMVEEIKDEVSKKV